MDSDHYVKLSDNLLSKGEDGIPETDDLEGARTGLKAGYGQSKWVSEKLLMEASQRGFHNTIVRPGYVVGDSVSAGEFIFGLHLFQLTSHLCAATNTDDFLWRLVKGCTQIGFAPEINNTINMVPVDHVARCITGAVLAPSSNTGPFVLNITARPPVTYNTLLGSLSRYGYAVEKCDYIAWRQKLEQHVLEVQDNALFPLLHFVLDDLPTSTKSAELSDSNTVSVLKKNSYAGQATVDDDLMGLYFAWLVAADFLPQPSGKGVPLPALQSAGQVKALGRSGA